VAGVALDPRQLMSEVDARSHAVDDAPLLLSRPVAATSPLPPVRQDPAVAALHEEWRRVHAAGGTPPVARRGIRGAIRARLAAVAADAVGPVQHDDRALIGDAIRAADAIALRADELAQRLADLEALVEEIVHVVSEDLVHIRAQLAGASPAGDPTPGTPAGDG